MAYQSSYDLSNVLSGADSLFQQADTNHDGRIDVNEFRNFLGQSHGGGASYGSSDASYGGYSGSASYGADASYGGYSGGVGYESADSSFGGFDGGASSYDSSSFSSSGGYSADAGYISGGAVDVGASNYDSSASYSSAGYSADASVVTGGAVAEDETSYESSTTQTTHVQQYPTDAQGLYKDPNPQLIHRPATGGAQTYVQSIKLRFLQPPPPPPPGPLIIKEIRAPQPPPLPPLRVRQQGRARPQAPALILRERPPAMPPVIPAQTVIRRLGPLPIPPRSVIIERLPPLPPRPRDIIIERWLPYGARAKRKVIVQRAAPAVPYPPPRNVIVQYDQPQVRIVRRFERLGVVQINPQVYLQQYGVTLLDAGTLVQQARAAGVVEDITPPHVAGGAAFNTSAYNQESSFDSFSGLDGGIGLDAGFGGGYSSSFDTSVDYGSSGLSSGGAILSAGIADHDIGGVASSSTGISVGGSRLAAGGVDAAFAAADTNKDGTLDKAEFGRLISGGGGASATTSI